MSLLEVAITAPTKESPVCCFNPLLCKTNTAFWQKQKFDSQFRKERRTDSKGKKEADIKAEENRNINTSSNKTEFTASAKLQASQTSEKLMSPAGPQGIVGRENKAASLAADAASHEKILNNRSHPAMGASPSWWHPAWPAPRCSSRCRASPAYPVTLWHPAVGHSSGQHPAPAPLACSHWHIYSFSQGSPESSCMFELFMQASRIY